MEVEKWSKLFDENEIVRDEDFIHEPIPLTPEILNGTWEHDISQSEDPSKVSFHSFL